MKSTNQRGWMRQYVLPTLVMIGALTLTLLIFDDSIWGLMGFVVAFPLAFMIGYILQPTHAWVSPAIMVVVALVVINIAAAVSDLDPAGNIWLAIGLVTLAGLPLTFLIWLGRESDYFRERKGPRASAT